MNGAKTAGEEDTMRLIATIRRHCGGKFYANYCGDKMLAATKKAAN